MQHELTWAIVNPLTIIEKENGEKNRYCSLLVDAFTNVNKYNLIEKCYKHTHIK